MKSFDKPMHRNSTPTFNRLTRRTAFAACLFTLFLLFTSLPASPVAAEDKGNESRSSFSAWSPPLKFFQKYISIADGDRCPMYPSCSHYAEQAFKRHGAFKGWVLTCDRLLRCGHDEVRLSPKVRANGRPRTFDPVEANTRWWRRP